MLANGTRIGPRYVIERLLGQGGMSNLYIARDLTANNAVRVIKEMSASYPDPHEQKMAEQLFEREAQLLATLNHPHIPKVYDKFIFQGKYYLSMEYVQGEDMGKLITDRGTIEEKWVAAWGAQMATVLYYLHRQNPPIVFRDVKPSNIMIVNEQVKLIDFGIARMFTSAKKGDTMRIGSPGYAPPEQYGGQTDPRSDIYALGVTLHHAATGYDPTISQTPFVIPPARNLNPKVSPELESILAKACQLDPDKRYQNCLDLKKDLQNVMRAHGMLVGGSVPFSSVASPTSSAAPSPVAPTSVAPPPAAPVANNSATQAPAPTPTPVPTPAAVPQPTVAATPTSTAAAKAAPRRLPLGALVSLGLLLGAGVGLAKAPESWRQKAWLRLQALAQEIPSLTQSGPKPSTAQQVLLGGGPLLAAVEALAPKDLSANPLAELDYQNALAYASGRPLKYLCVLAPVGRQAAQSLAFYQRLSWDEPNRDQSVLVIDCQEVAAEDWRAAVRRAYSDQRFRDKKRADALLVLPPEVRPPGWSDWFGEGPELYWASAPSAADPPRAKALAPASKLTLDSLKALGLGEPHWLSKGPAPSGMPPSAAGTTEAMSKLIKQSPKPLLVIDPAQLEEMSKLPAARLLVIYPVGQWPLAPPPAGQNKVYAYTQASIFSAEPMVSAYYQAKTPPPADFFDKAAWCGALLLGATRQTGLSWHLDRKGQVEAARWNLLELRQSEWIFARTSQ